MRRHEHVLGKPAHAVVGQALELRPVVEVRAALLLERLAVVAVTTRKRVAYDDFVTDRPLVRIDVVAQPHDLAGNLVTADERILDLVDTRVHALLPRAQGAAVNLHEHLVALGTRTLALLERNIHAAMEYRRLHRLWHGDSF